MATPLQVDILPRAEAVAFLRTRIGRDDPTAGALAAALGDLPLALEQTAAYLEQHPTSLGDYLGLFRERAGELLGLGELADHPDTVATRDLIGRPGTARSITEGENHPAQLTRAA